MDRGEGDRTRVEGPRGGGSSKKGGERGEREGGREGE